LGEYIRERKYPDNKFSNVGEKAAGELENKDEQEQPKPEIICPNPGVKEKSYFNNYSQHNAHPPEHRQCFSNSVWNRGDKWSNDPIIFLDKIGALYF
jgi:hypothetical protein